MPAWHRVTVEVEMFDDVEAKGALVLVAFHSTGAAAPIAAAYLRQSLSLPIVGHIRVPELGPVVQVADGVATSPIRILGGEVACSVGKDCDRLYVVAGDLPVPLAIADEIAQAILAWAKDATFVLCLDAVVRDKEDHEPDVFMLANGKDALAHLRSSKAEPLEGGIIVGTTAAILAAGKKAGVEVGALVVEAVRNHPDGRAAAQLVQALDPLIPTIKIDPGPLIKEATELEAQMEKALREAQQAQPQKPVHTFI